ncbi:MAG TPA: flagellar hook-associated protein 3, partial [Bacteroidetes bacterium]|nr:flagellar hook-associated protein 3 [Bacteroidota bacterium]
SQIISQNFIRNLDDHLVRLNRYQEEISSGKRVNKPSDDPFDASRIIEIMHQLKLNDQYKRNIQDGLQRLNETENYLNDLQNLVTRSKDLAIQGANGTLSKDDLNGLSKEVNQILEQVASISNKKSFDEYIFGGTYGKVPFKIERDENGDITAVTGAGSVDGKIYRQIGTDKQTIVNIDNKDLFTGDQTVFDDLIQLRDALKEKGQGEAITDAIGNLKSRLDVLVDRISEIGVRINSIDDQKNMIDEENMTLKQFLGDIQDTDIAQTYVYYQQEQIAYQAALQAGGQLLQQSFVNFLR